MNEEAVSLWIRKAEGDLKIGRDELSTDEPATEAVCFHMQQCAEKYLKAFLIYHGEEYPRTHDIAFILNKCAEIDSGYTRILDKGVASLTKYATGVRYEEETFPSLEETNQALTLAESVRDFVLIKFKEAGFQPKKIP